MGGTGSYVLDLISKTHVGEIRLFDADHMLSHNAYRSPGAASLEQLREVPLKVEYWARIYGNMHRHIKIFPERLTGDNVSLLEGTTFAFLCNDDGPSKDAIMDRLEEQGASFIDVGMGLDVTESGLSGIARITMSTPDDRAIARARVPTNVNTHDDIYHANIQVADLNSLNAALAVIKWKQFRRYFVEENRSFSTLYGVDANVLTNWIGDEDN